MHKVYRLKQKKEVIAGCMDALVRKAAPRATDDICTECLYLPSVYVIHVARWYSYSPERCVDPTRLVGAFMMLVDKVRV